MDASETSSHEHAFHVDNMKGGGGGEYGHRLSGPNHRMLLVGEPTLPHKREGIGQSVSHSNLERCRLPARDACRCCLLLSDVSPFLKQTIIAQLTSDSDAAQLTCHHG